MLHTFYFVICFALSFAYVLLYVLHLAFSILHLAFCWLRICLHFMGGIMVSYPFDAFAFADQLVASGMDAAQAKLIAQAQALCSHAPYYNDGELATKKDLLEHCDKVLQSLERINNNIADNDVKREADVSLARAERNGLGNELKANLNEIREAFLQLRNDLKTTLIQTHSQYIEALAKIQTEFKTGNASLRTEYKAEMAEMHAETKVFANTLENASKAHLTSLQGEYKAEMAELRAEHKDDNAILRAEFVAEISRLKNSLLLWFVGCSLASAFGILIMLFALFKKLP